MHRWAALSITSLLLLCCAGRTPPREAISPPAADTRPAAADRGEPREETLPHRTQAPKPAPPGDTGQGAGPFTVSREVYSRTFEEVESFIARMNEIIQNRDFDTWKTHLSGEYLSKVSDPVYLEEQSRQPLLKQNGIQLECLRDYFEQVVAPSRSGARLDAIEFIDEDHVKAISVIRGTRGVLYLLVREEGRWKIGIW